MAALIDSNTDVPAEVPSLWMAGNGSFDRLVHAMDSDSFRLWMAGNGSFDRLESGAGVVVGIALDGREWQL